MKNGNPNTQYDRGGPNHIKVKMNDCGCVMEMDVDDTSGTLKATKARMLTCGMHNTGVDYTDFCDRNHIANPDNVAMVPDYNQLIIGEDTGKHSNNLLWIWDLPTGAMTRIASTPTGAETTGPYWYTIGDYSYMSYVVQHPRSDVTGRDGYVGYVGPFPRSSLVAHKDEPEPDCHACHAVATIQHQINDLENNLEARCPAAGTRRALCAGLEESTTAAPSPLGSYTHEVKVAISLPMSKADFTPAKKTDFRTAIAAAADASPADVKIDKIGTIEGDRRSGGIRVDTSVKAKDADSAKNMAKQLTIEAINEELTNRGLPEGKMLQEAVAVAKPVLEAEPEEEKELSNNMEALAIGLSCGLGVVFLGGLVAYSMLGSRAAPAPAKGADLPQMPATMPPMQAAYAYAPQQQQMQFQHPVMQQQTGQSQA